MELTIHDWEFLKKFENLFKSTKKIKGLRWGGEDLELLTYETMKHTHSVYPFKNSFSKEDKEFLISCFLDFCFCIGTHFHNDIYKGNYHTSLRSTDYRIIYSVFEVAIRNAFFPKGYPAYYLDSLGYSSLLDSIFFSMLTGGFNIKKRNDYDSMKTLFYPDKTRSHYFSGIGLNFESIESIIPNLRSLNFKIWSPGFHDFIPCDFTRMAAACANTENVLLFDFSSHARRIFHLNSSKIKLLHYKDFLGKSDAVEVLYVLAKNFSEGSKLISEDDFKNFRFSESHLAQATSRLKSAFKNWDIGPFKLRTYSKKKYAKTSYELINFPCSIIAINNPRIS